MKTFYEEPEFEVRNYTQKFESIIVTSDVTEPDLNDGDNTHFGKIL